jgi:subtilisin-like proprotein convertase family protein
VRVRERVRNTSTPTSTPTPSVVLICNTGAITIRDNTSSNPNSSNINVSGLGSNTTDVNVRVVGVSHTRPDDIDLLLVGPLGQKLLLWSDARGSSGINNVTVTLDTQATNALPKGGTITTGSYRPANYSGNDRENDVFPSPAPPGPYTTSLAALNGTNPNGTWQLYVRDDRQGNPRSISGRWCVQLTTAP